jgi:hydroxymethylpyrimidine pyrophosphatase-like HAD family hydrolase
LRHDEKSNTFPYSPFDGRRFLAVVNNIHRLLHVLLDRFGGRRHDRLFAETNTVKFDAKVVASFTDAHLAHAVKITGISSNLDLVAACEKVAQNSLGDKASAARSPPYYLDVTSPKATKGTVVATLSKLLNIPPPRLPPWGTCQMTFPCSAKAAFPLPWAMPATR